MTSEEKRIELCAPDGKKKRACYAKPVVIESNCWFGENVTVCSGVTIAEGCVIREITEMDSVKQMPACMAQ